MTVPNDPVVAADSSFAGFVRPSVNGIGDDDDLANAMETVIRGITGLPKGMLWPRWQRIPPARPGADQDWAAFEAVNFAPMAALASETHSPANGGTSEIEFPEVVDFLVSFYGPQSRANARLLAAGLRLEQNQDECFRLGLAYRGTESVIATAEIVNTVWYRRVDVTVQFHVTSGLTYAIRSFLQAQGTIRNDTGLAQPFLTKDASP